MEQSLLGPATTVLDADAAALCNVDIFVRCGPGVSPLNIRPTSQVAKSVVLSKERCQRTAPCVHR
jgi:hypothetical protein